MAMSHVVSPTRIPPGEPDRAEHLAAALDLQQVGYGGNRWVVHVLGVHDDGHHLWVQIAPHEDGTQSIVLRLPMAATAPHVLETLATLPPSTVAGSTVVPVTCA